MSTPSRDPRASWTIASWACVAACGPALDFDDRGLGEEMVGTTGNPTSSPEAETSETSAAGTTEPETTSTSTDDGPIEPQDALYIARWASSDPNVVDVFKLNFEHDHCLLLRIENAEIENDLYDVSVGAGSQQWSLRWIGGRAGVADCESLTPDSPDAHLPDSAEGTLGFEPYIGPNGLHCTIRAFVVGVRFEDVSGLPELDVMHATELEVEGACD